MPNSRLEGFGNTDLLLNPYDLDPSISEDIQQAIARLLAFYEPGKLFKALRCDVSGRLLVSLADVSQPVITQSATTVNAIETTILIANVNRKKFFLQNLGPNDFYLYFVSGLSTAYGLLFMAGTTYSDDSYIGAVYGKTISGSASVRYLEY